MQKQILRQKDTNAWILQCWVSFIFSLSATAVGVIYLQVDPWQRAFMGIGLTFSVSSSFTLAKTIRDNNEATTLTARIDEARVEKILADHHPLK